VVKDDSMTVRELLAFLEHHPNASLHWMLPDGSFVPAHFHITEVGRVQKDFIDCGGTRRSQTSCLLQIWVADDTEHRLQTTKLAEILKLAGPVLGVGDLPVEVEYEQDAVSQYPLGGVELTPSGVLFTLGSKHTACLAPEKCGVDGSDCCGPTGPRQVLFVCIHNSARSQMAEAFVNQMCQGSFVASSAGLEPGQLNPLVVEAMQEVGIDISAASTTGVAEVLAAGRQFDRVITVCDEASAERCPTFPGPVAREHWGFPDPSAASGSREEKLAQVREIRDAIRQRITDWCRLACLH
jgi:arsenate reductase